MTEDADIDRFTGATTLDELREATLPLLQTSGAARASKSSRFEQAFASWCERLEAEREDALPMTAALWRLTSLGSMSRHRQRLRRSLVKPRSPFAAPLITLSDPKDRRAVAESLMVVEAEWVIAYCAEAITRDPDPKSDARDALCRVLLRRTGDVAAAFEALAATIGSVRIEQTDVATGRARRVAWILRSMRPALYEDEEAVAETGTGEAYMSFVFGGLKSSPNDRSAALDAVREVLLCLNGIVRLHGVSVGALPSTYAVLSSIRRRIGWHDWPEELAEPCGVVGVRIEEALMARARQGVADGELRKAYVSLFGEVVAPRRLAKALGRTTGIDEDVAFWLENGRPRIQMESSSALEEAALSAIDADLAMALIQLDELRRSSRIDPADAVIRRLVRSLDDAARRRGLVLRGMVGDRVEYSPGEHLLDRADMGARDVVLLRPVVDRVVDGRPMGVVLKAEVEPA